MTSMGQRQVRSEQRLGQQGGIPSAGALPRTCEGTEAARNDRCWRLELRPPARAQAEEQACRLARPPMELGRAAVARRPAMDDGLPVSPRGRRNLSSQRPSATATGYEQPLVLPQPSHT